MGWSAVVLRVPFPPQLGAVDVQSSLDFEAPLIVLCAKLDGGDSPSFVSVGYFLKLSGTASSGQFGRLLSERELKS